MVRPSGPTLTRRGVRSIVHPAASAPMPISVGIVVIICRAIGPARPRIATTNPTTAKAIAAAPAAIHIVALRPAESGRTKTCSRFNGPSVDIGLPSGFGEGSAPERPRGPPCARPLNEKKLGVR